MTPERGSHPESHHSPGPGVRHWHSARHGACVQDPCRCSTIGERTRVPNRSLRSVRHGRRNGASCPERPDRRISCAGRRPARSPSVAWTRRGYRSCLPSASTPPTLPNNATPQRIARRRHRPAWSQPRTAAPQPRAVVSYRGGDLPSAGRHPAKGAACCLQTVRGGGRAPVSR